MNLINFSIANFVFGATWNALVENCLHLTIFCFISFISFTFQVLASVIVQNFQANFWINYFNYNGYNANPNYLYAIMNVFV